MDKKTRPKCVTVIGWIWIILGLLLCFSASIALALTDGVGEGGSGSWLLLHLLTQLGMGTVGSVSGVMFLKLRAWARRVLSGLTWVIFLFAVGSMIIWFVKWGSTTLQNGLTMIQMFGGLMGVVIGAVYIIPLWVMLGYLRGAEVKKAMEQR